MILRVFFGQRRERHEGQFLPEVLEATTEHQLEDECAWFQDKVDKMSVQGRDEFSGFAVVDIEVDDDKIRQFCLRVPSTTGNPKGAERKDGVLDALKVMAWDRRTRAYLREHDPKALGQAEQALRDAGEAPACGWDNLDG